MRTFQVFSRAECTLARSTYASFLIVALSCVSVLAVDPNSSQETPLERAGLKPVFQENFTDGSLDAMRYEPAYGSREQFNTYIQPGAIFWGKKMLPRILNSR